MAEKHLNILKTDVNKMIEFIKHETAGKIKEIKTRGAEEYNEVKASEMKISTIALKTKHSDDLRYMNENFLSNICNLKKDLSKKLAKQKEDFVEEIFKAVQLKLKHTEINENLIKSVIKYIDGSMYIFCNRKDEKIISSYLLNNNLKNKISIRYFERENLGGLIGISKDEKILCDNTYEKRILYIRERMIDKILFFIEN